MKILICGVGSIGERHIKNLLSLGEKDISVLRRSHKKLRTINKTLKTFTNTYEAIASKPEIAFITNPTSFHVPIAIELAKVGCHLFIEKPLSSSTKGLDTLVRTAKRKGIIIQMGFMMRYHPAFIQIRKWIKNNVIGEILSARVMWGEYLPSWHPWENYKKGYSARKDLGGGPIFTLCHDLDLLTWMFGEVKYAFSLKAKKSSLGISTEDNVEILLRHKNGIVSECHLDYISSPPKRVWDIIGDFGRIEFDYYKNKLTLFKRKNGKIRKVSISYDGFDRNEMFIAQAKDFIKHIKNNDQPDADLKSGIVNLKLLLSIHKSIKEERVVNID